MALTDTACRNAKPRDKAYKLSDAEGLHLLVQTNGSRLWRLAYRFDGKQRTMSLGPYPKITLGKAREIRHHSRMLLALGEDPSAARDAEVVDAARTFKAIAQEWLEHWKTDRAATHILKTESLLERFAYPTLGERHIASITPPEMLDVIRAVEAKGTLDAARRLRQKCNAIYRYAKAAGMVTTNPASSDLLEAMKPQPKPKKMTALPASEMPRFMKVLDRHECRRATKMAIEFALLTWTRSGETRGATWSEIEGLNGPAPLWRIPPHRMKMRREHLVPLTPPAVSILRQMPRDEDLIFPSRKPRTPLSATTMIGACYRMGFEGDMTIHGFRHLASTMANEHRWDADWVERQLAHVDSNKIRGTYNAAEWIEGRREMLLWWSGIVDGWRPAATVDYESLLG